MMGNYFLSRFIGGALALIIFGLGLIPAQAAQEVDGVSISPPLKFFSNPQLTGDPVCVLSKWQLQCDGVHLCVWKAGKYRPAESNELVNCQVDVPFFTRMIELPTEGKTINDTFVKVVDTSKQAPEVLFGTRRLFVDLKEISESNLILSEATERRRLAALSKEAAFVRFYGQLKSCLNGTSILCLSALSKERVHVGILLALEANYKFPYKEEEDGSQSFLCDKIGGDNYFANTDDFLKCMDRAVDQKDVWKEVLGKPRDFPWVRVRTGIEDGFRRHLKGMRKVYFLREREWAGDVIVAAEFKEGWKIIGFDTEGDF